jgi:cell volume regulation protein A
VVIQSILVPAATTLLRIPTRTVEPESWALGVRLRDEPGGVHRFTAVEGVPADCVTIEDLTQLPDDVWVSFIVRNQQLVSIGSKTELRAGDEVLVLGDPRRADALRATFERAR